MPPFDVLPASKLLEPSQDPNEIGSRDRFVTSERLAEEEARLRSGSMPHRLVRYEGGHAIDPKALGDLARTMSDAGA